MWSVIKEYYIDVFVQNCNISTADALEILQSCTNPSTYSMMMTIARYNAGYDLTNKLYL